VLDPPVRQASSLLVSGYSLYGAAKQGPDGGCTPATLRTGPRLGIQAGGQAPTMLLGANLNGSESQLAFAFYAVVF